MQGPALVPAYQRSSDVKQCGLISQRQMLDNIDQFTLGGAQHCRRWGIRIGVVGFPGKVRGRGFQLARNLVKLGG